MGSIDERLRIGLRANAESWSPPVERRLDEAKQRAARRRRGRWSLLGAAAAAVAVTLVVILQFVAGDRGAQPVPATPPIANGAILGAYERDLPADQAAQPDMAGTWRLSFEPAGTLDVTAPPAYGGVVSAALYALEGRVLRMDLFSQDQCSGTRPGRYAVDVRAASLTLTPIDEPCETRRTFLSGGSWKETP